MINKHLVLLYTTQIAESSKGVGSMSRLVVDDDLPGLGHVAEDGVESVETLTIN